MASSATVVQCNLGTLGGLGADVRNVSLTWRATVVGPAVINASATLNSDNDSNAFNSAADAVTTVVQGVNLSYSLTVDNAGPNDSASLVITDNLPPVVSSVSASGSGWACSAAGRAVTCSRASLAVGSSNDITVVASAPASVAAGGSSFSNTAAITGSTPEPDPANNAAAVNVQVRLDGADLRLAKTKTPDPVALGSNLASTITVTNGGPPRPEHHQDHQHAGRRRQAAECQ